MHQRMMLTSARAAPCRRGIVRSAQRGRPACSAQHDPQGARRERCNAERTRFQRGASAGRRSACSPSRTGTRCGRTTRRRAPAPAPAPASGPPSRPLWRPVERFACAILCAPTRAHRVAVPAGHSLRRGRLPRNNAAPGAGLGDLARQLEARALQRLRFVGGADARRCDGVAWLGFAGGRRSQHALRRNALCGGHV